MVNSLSCYGDVSFDITTIWEEFFFLSKTKHKIVYVAYLHTFVRQKYNTCERDIYVHKSMRYVDKKNKYNKS